ncbi:unnamed protein product, partial [Mesorhabditis belari]|uniref:Uncharacterized protein n=1 Tax=Mesorhabditis belari TaxID=2138241 RepID=A0AAF3EEH7_9BILA
MGACGSCLRLMLDAESDVKIHVIEPTSIAQPEQSVVITRPPTAHGPTLQVPSGSRKAQMNHLTVGGEGNP